MFRGLRVRRDSVASHHGGVSERAEGGDLANLARSIIGILFGIVDRTIRVKKNARRCRVCVCVCVGCPECFRRTFRAVLSRDGRVSRHVSRTHGAERTRGSAPEGQRHGTAARRCCGATRCVSPVDPPRSGLRCLHVLRSTLR